MHVRIEIASCDMKKPHVTATLDDEMVTLNKGDVLRISPATKRQFKASDKEGTTYFCIQVKADSLGEYTANDAAIYYNKV